jgi:hypothetical protein
MEGSRSAAKPPPAESTSAIADLIVTRTRLMSCPPKKMYIAVLLTVRRATSTWARDAAFTDPEPGKD